MTKEMTNEFYKRAVIGRMTETNRLLAELLDEQQTTVVILRTIMAEQAEMKADLRCRSVQLPNILSPTG